MPPSSPSTRRGVPRNTGDLAIIAACAQPPAAFLSVKRAQSSVPFRGSFSTQMAPMRPAASTAADAWARPPAS